MLRRSLLAALAGLSGARASAAPPAMSDDRFWAIIDRTIRFAAQNERQLDALRSELAALSAGEVAAFDAVFEAQMNRAYAWSLWGAAYVAEGGCSDDGFVYFRVWLISRGRAVYEAVLSDPDHLADLDVAAGPEGALEFEMFAYVPREVLAAKGGRNDGGLPGGDPTFEKPRASRSRRIEPGSRRAIRGSGSDSAHIRPELRPRPAPRRTRRA
jgi:hypothetical protein